MTPGFAAHVLKEFHLPPRQRLFFSPCNDNSRSWGFKEKQPDPWRLLTQILTSGSRAPSPTAEMQTAAWDMLKQPTAKLFITLLQVKGTEDAEADITLLNCPACTEDKQQIPSLKPWKGLGAATAWRFPTNILLKENMLGFAS